MRDLKRWEDQIKSEGTSVDKNVMIDSWMFDRFEEPSQNLASDDEEFTTMDFVRYKPIGAK